ncbi:unnamed protein product, partial [marine sediment metagenome]
RECPYCQQKIEVKTGFSKDNIRKLFRKPTFQEY